MSRTLMYLALVAGASVLRPVPSLAAESYDNCTGFITSVPATITTQGVWCMDRDLSTAIASGHAITVATNNVTIDCNHFKLGGLQAGPETQAGGIHSYDRLNVTVRNCNIRGFLRGVYLGYGGGHLVESSRFDGNTHMGILLEQTPGSIIRNNLVIDTGGSLAIFRATGIRAQSGVDVIDNTVIGVAPAADNQNATGIETDQNSRGSVAGNRVRGLQSTGTGVDRGIYNNNAGGIIVRDNSVQGSRRAGGVGIHCTTNRATARDNVITDFETGIANCLSSSNSVNPN